MKNCIEVWCNWSPLRFYYSFTAIRRLTRESRRRQWRPKSAAMLRLLITARRCQQRRCRLMGFELTSIRCCAGEPTSICWSIDILVVIQCVMHCVLLVTVASCCSCFFATYHRWITMSRPDYACTVVLVMCNDGDAEQQRGRRLPLNRPPESRRRWWSLITVR